ncbi:hypothetical protein [Rhodococcus sp. 1139]|uniref:hypothetical protein n=1 Tax=Rhodococcus sp. 1139 TaxID=1833762 RepID=UPI0008720B66|nr:hypothetical protein [Rhodococcus sp. 1139]OFE08007.1 hypothetical protein A5N83_14870 [Rhodococcus sp. 1139]
MAMNKESDGYARGFGRLLDPPTNDAEDAVIGQAAKENAQTESTGTWKVHGTPEAQEATRKARDREGRIAEDKRRREERARNAVPPKDRGIGRYLA